MDRRRFLSLGVALPAARAAAPCPPEANGNRAKVCAVWIESFGAIGDGTHDDTPAFLAFQRYAKGLPEGHAAVLNCARGKTYLCTNAYWPNDIKTLTVNGNGCAIQNISTNKDDGLLLSTALGMDRDGVGTVFNPVERFLIQTTAAGDATARTLLAADAARLEEGEYVLVGSFDQQFSGQPVNLRRFDFAKVASVDGKTGTIKFDRRLKHVHQADLPYVPYNNGDGRAAIYRVEQGSKFDIEHTYNDIEFRKAAHGLRGGTTEAAYLSGRRVVMNRCKAPYFLPTVCEHATLNECIQTEPGEVDKLVELVEYRGGIYMGHISSATGVNTMRAKGTRFLGGYRLCAKTLELAECDVRGSPIQILDAFGTCETLQIVGGAHESLPECSTTTTQTRSVTIGSRGVSWVNGVLALSNLSTSYRIANFVAACFSGQVVYVTQSRSGHDVASGTAGVVTAVTGLENEASVKIDFNTPLFGTEQLTIFCDPRRTDVQNVKVGEHLVTQNWISHPHTYIRSGLLLTSGSSVNLSTLGRITRLVADVLRPYTGPTIGNVTLQFSSEFPGGFGSRFSASLDLKTRGRREANLLGSSGFTGNAGESADVRLARASSADSFIGSMTYAASTMKGVTDQLPIIALKIEFESPYQA